MDFLIAGAVFVIISMLLPQFNMSRISKLEKRFILDRHADYANMATQSLLPRYSKEPNDSELEYKEIEPDLKIQANESSDDAYVASVVEENQSVKYQVFNNVYPVKTMVALQSKKPS